MKQASPGCGIAKQDASNSRQFWCVRQVYTDVVCFMLFDDECYLVRLESMYAEPITLCTASGRLTCQQSFRTDLNYLLSHDPLPEVQSRLPSCRNPLTCFQQMGSSVMPLESIPGALISIRLSVQIFTTEATTLLVPHIQ